MPSDPALHPAFEAHFRHPLYRDYDDDLAPFGSDEGADALSIWAERRSELGPGTTLRAMLTEDFGDLDGLLDRLRHANPPQVDVEAIVVGTGFALLALTGRLDPEGKIWVIEALDRTRAFYTDGFDDYRNQMVGDLSTYAPNSVRTPGTPTDGPSADRPRLIDARPSWLSVDTYTDGNRGSSDVRNRREFVRQHQAGYRQKMVWLQDQLNGGCIGRALGVTPWSEWWDQQGNFIGVYVAVNYKTGAAPAFRFRSNRSAEGAVNLMVSAVLDLDGIADHAAGNPSKGASRHLTEVLEAIGTRCRLGPSPELPQTKQERQAGA